MKFELKPDNRNVSDKDLIEDVVIVVKRLNKETITREEYNEYGRFSEGTLRKRFGGWLKVLELAKLPPTRSYSIEIEDLFKNIQEVWISLGRQPYTTDMKSPLSKFSVPTYARHFGNWRKTLEKFVEYINSDETELIENIDKKETTIRNIPIKKHRTKREISDRKRFTILMRDGFTCKSCGRSPIKERDVELHVDHIIPWSKGGETVDSNLETKCKKCNLGKGNINENKE